MEGLKNIVKGASIFIIGYFVMIVTYQFLPELFSSLNGVYNSEEIEGIGWTMVLIVWSLLVYVMPQYWIIKGIQQTKNETSGFWAGITGVLMFLITLMLTVKAWYMIPVLTSLATTGIVQGFFLFGLIITWLEIQIGAPVYLILNAKE